MGESRQGNISKDGASLCRSGAGRGRAAGHDRD
jgi:hypothetical protein